MNTMPGDERRNTQTRGASAARDEAMVRAFATQFAVHQQDARKYLEGADWNYARAFEALLVSMRTADETDQIAKALAAILTPPTASEIQRHIELADKSAAVDCPNAPATTMVTKNRSCDPGP